MEKVVGTDRLVLGGGCAGLIGWVVLNLGMLKYKYSAGTLEGNELWPILLVTIFQVRTTTDTPSFASDRGLQTVIRF